MSASRSRYHNHPDDMRGPCGCSEAVAAGTRTTVGMRGKCSHGEGAGQGSGMPAASMAEASGSSSGTRHAAAPSPKPGLGADLAFHLNLASTRKSPGTPSAGSGDSTVPLATAVGESWAGWFCSHSQGLPESVGSMWWEVAWRSKVGCHGFVASSLCQRENRALTLPTPPSLVYGRVANTVSRVSDLAES